MGNYVDAEAVALDLVYRERNTVHRNRPLRSDKACEFGRRLEHEAHAAALRSHRDDPAHAVDMAIDQMTAQFVTNPERQFEVDAGTFAPVAEMGLGQALT